MKHPVTVSKEPALVAQIKQLQSPSSSPCQPAKAPSD